MLTVEPCKGNLLSWMVITMYNVILNVFYCYKSYQQKFVLQFLTIIVGCLLWINVDKLQKPIYKSHLSPTNFSSAVCIFYNPCKHTFTLIMGLTRENLPSGVCQQQGRRLACASVQSDQLIGYLCLESIISGLINFLAIICSWVGRFEYSFDGNPEDWFSLAAQPTVDIAHPSIKYTESK